MSTDNLENNQTTPRIESCLDRYNLLIANKSETHVVAREIGKNGTANQVEITPVDIPAQASLDPSSYDYARTTFERRIAG